MYCNLIFLSTTIAALSYLLFIFLWRRVRIYYSSPKSRVALHLTFYCHVKYELIDEVRNHFIFIFAVTATKTRLLRNYFVLIVV